MPPQVNFSRETILAEAFEIVRQRGLRNLSARSVAKRLHCSTKPIYRAFESMQELEKAVLHRIREYTVAYLLQEVEHDEVFLNIGLRYVQFAKEEKELFKIVYMSDKGMFSDPLLSPFVQLLERMKQDRHLQGLDESRFMRILKDMAIFTHGLATQVYMNPQNYPQEFIQESLQRMGRTIIEWEYYQHYDIQLPLPAQMGKECPVFP